MENPTNRYEAVLTRSATRQHTNGVQQKKKQEDDGDEIGDVTLGLKMKIIAGKVIIQQVKPQLIDGSATPVAASKQIKRGDVILALNGKSLIVNHIKDPGDRTAAAIKLLEPINTPNADGLYEKTVHLELARGEGLHLLERSEKAEEEFTNRPYTSSINNNDNNSSRRGSFFKRGGKGGGGGSGSAQQHEEEGYASFRPIVEANGNNNEDDPANNKKKSNNKGNKARVGGAAAVAGIAGLALLGPVTAVAAAGGAAYVAHKKNKSRQKRRENNSENKSDELESINKQ